MQNTSYLPTNDRAIRAALKAELQEIIDKEGSACPYIKIIDELGVAHGDARIDVAFVNGIIHGYELKSDVDSLDRLPWQVEIYGKVFEQITLIVGKKHLQRAIEIIPEWWGIKVAKFLSPDSERVLFYEIREARENSCQDDLSIAGLLWREEALSILEDLEEAEGVRSKTRNEIYKRLVAVLDPSDLRTRVRKQLCVRKGWRSDLRYSLSDG